MQLSNFINENKKNNLAWYPSSGLDFRDLLVFGQENFIYNKNAFANEIINFPYLPTYFIHTDSAYNNDNWPINNLGKLYSDEVSKYFVIEVENITNNDEIVGKYLIIEIESDLLKSKIKQKVIFLFSENISFFNDTILKNKLQISFLINIRDGFSENGGAKYSLKFLEFYLGLLKTKYLISDNFGRKPEILNNIEFPNSMKKYFHLKENYPVVLQGVKEFNWSDFGLFQGDAFLMEVHRFE